MPSPFTCGISNPFGLLSPALGQVAHVLRDRSPLGIATPFDLHFLGTSQAFVLSQDQTLHEWLFELAVLRSNSRYPQRVYSKNNYRDYSKHTGLYKEPRATLRLSETW